MYRTNLDEASAPIERELQILDLAKVGKFIVDIIFLCFLVYSSDENDPALDS